MNAEEFDLWCRKLRLPAETRKLIEHIRASPPSRNVHSGLGVSGKYPSRKMGQTIQFESHKNELAFIRELEIDNETLEFYDQPPPIKLLYSSSNGRNMGVIHTPDFFVLHKSGAEWVECKIEEDLLRLSVKQPNRYWRDESGKWRCPPGENYAAQFGLQYNIRSSAEINWSFQRNCEFLEDYYRGINLVSDEARHIILQAVRNKPGITLDQLLDCLGNAAQSDDVYAMIVDESIFVDLCKTPLDEPRDVQIFVDHIAAEAFANIEHLTSPAERLPVPTVTLVNGTKIDWDGAEWIIANIGASKVSLINVKDEAIRISLSAFHELVRTGVVKGNEPVEFTTFHPEVERILQTAKSDALAKANESFELLKAIENGFPAPDIKVSKRTIKRRRNNFERAEKLYGNGFVGLIELPRPGNRNPRFDVVSEELLKKTIKDEYENIKQKKISTAYGAYRNACKEKSVQPASYKTFRRRIKARPVYEQTRARKGPRGAYEHKEFHYYLYPQTPQHGSHPFNIAHIDHTLMDVELNDSKTGKNFMRAWLTLMIDSFTRRILAFYVSFDNPSKIACMMVMRECVRRYGRLPRIIVVDNGKEFLSVYFDTLLALYDITKKVRPPAEARFGSVIERMFGTANTQFFHNLAGNTQIMKNVRQVTVSVNPKNNSEWTLPELCQSLNRYFYEIYDTLIHSTLGESPRDAFNRGMSKLGERKISSISYTEDFEILTLPEIQRISAKVIPGKGVKINYIFYTCQAFREPNIQNKKVTVRFDPWDAGRVYALVNGRWTICHSDYYQKFRGRSVKEVEIATKELYRRLGAAGRAKNITAEKIAHFISSEESEKLLHKQRVADRERRTALRVVQDGSYVIEKPEEKIVVADGTYGVAPQSFNEPKSNRNEEETEAPEASDNVIEFPKNFVIYETF